MEELRDIGDLEREREVEPWRRFVPRESWLDLSLS